MATKTENSKAEKIAKASPKKILLDKYFGKVKVYGDGVKYQRKLRDE